jgi:ribosomal protein S18 acetylase RimI-like enzyme
MSDIDAGPLAGQLRIRRYGTRDREAVYDICVRTADNGDDASDKFTDLGLLPDIWAGPYLFFEPELAFVLDDGRRPVGYVLGTVDTAAFVRSYRKTWLPLMAGRRSRLPDAPSNPDGELLDVFHNPERMLRPELARYPAHLHIDILVGYRGAGNGRRLIDTFAGAAARAGAAGVHVGVGSANGRAQGFYERLGFVKLAVAAPGTVAYYGRSLVAELPVAATSCTQNVSRGPGRGA